MDVIYETAEQEQLYELGQKSGSNGLWDDLKLRGLVQITHLVSTDRYDDARKVVDILERVKAI